MWQKSGSNSQTAFSAGTLGASAIQTNKKYFFRQKSFHLFSSSWQKSWRQFPQFVRWHLKNFDIKNVFARWLFFHRQTFYFFVCYKIFSFDILKKYLLTAKMLRQFFISCADFFKNIFINFFISLVDIFYSFDIQNIFARRLFSVKFCATMLTIKKHQHLTHAKNQFGFSFWYYHLFSKLHFVLRDKIVVLIPKLLLARER